MTFHQPDPIQEIIPRKEKLYHDVNSFFSTFCANEKLINLCTQSHIILFKWIDIEVGVILIWLTLHNVFGLL